MNLLPFFNLNRMKKGYKVIINHRRGIYYEEPFIIEDWVGPLPKREDYITLPDSEEELTISYIIFDLKENIIKIMTRTP